MRKDLIHKKTSVAFVSIILSCFMFLIIDPSPVSPQVSCVTPPSNLISWWPGDGNPGDIVSINEGSLVGDATFDTGHVLQGFKFDGNGDFVDAGDHFSTDLSRAGQFTLDAWIKTPSPGTFQEIVSNRQAFIRIDSNKLKLFVYTGTFNSVVSAVSIPANTFVHVAGTWDGIAMKVYVDGVLEGSAPLSGTIQYPTGSHNLFIGSDRGLVGFFNGIVDEVDFFDRALDGTEIASIANAQTGGKCKPVCGNGIIEVGETCDDGNTDPLDGCDSGCKTETGCADGLVSLWKAEGDATDSFDDGFGVNDGTITGATFAPGQLGQAFEFDGIDDHIFIGDPLNLRLGDDITLEAWVRPRAGFTLANMHVISRFGVGTRGPMISVNDGAGDVVIFCTRDGSNCVTSSTGLAANQWSHIVGTWDAVSGLGKVYINGVLAASGSILAPRLTSAPYEIGRAGNQNANYFSGGIDEVAIYNEALSSVAVLEHYINGVASNRLDACQNQGACGDGVVGAGEECDDGNNVDGDGCSSICAVDEACPLDLLSYWKADSNVVDVVGGANGILLSTVGFNPGLVGQAFNFGGGVEEVRLPFNWETTFNTGDPYTVSVWINTGLQANDALLFNSDVGGPDHHILLRLDGRLVVRTYGGSAPESDVTVDDDNWHHVVFGTDGVNGIFYVDGYPQTDVPGVGAFNRGKFTRLGRRGGGDPYVGLLDELAIFDRALTSDEILALFAKGSLVLGVCAPLLCGNGVVDVGEECDDGNNTPGDGCSSICEVENPPTIGEVVLESSLGTDTEFEDLTATLINVVDLDGDDVKTITDWRLASSSIAVLNMPFEGPNTFVSTRDYSTFGNDGTVIGRPVFRPTDGFDGFGAYEFDGTTKHIDVADSPSLNITTNITVEARITYPGGLGDGFIRIIAAKEDNNFGTGYGLLLKENTGGFAVARFDVFDDFGGRSLVSGTTELSTGVYHHLVGTYDGSTMNIYVDGVLENSTPNTGNIINTSTAFRIGAGALLGSNRFSGFIDEVRVYNRALSAEQVAQLATGNTLTLVPQETADADTWQVCVIPNDRMFDGTEVCSNTITVNAAPPPPETFFVDASATGPGDGSAGAPFAGIQGGIDAAADGDTVVVAAGIYTGAFVINKNITVRGVDRATTICDGTGLPFSPVIIESDPPGSGTTTQGVLESFTVTAAAHSGLPGGGIHVGDFTGATIRDCLIIGNETTPSAGNNQGGGIAIGTGSSVIIENCVISDNTAADSGGAITIVGTNTGPGVGIPTSLVVTNCEIIGNTSGGLGGAIFAQNFGVTVTLTDCTIRGNSATAGGTGLYLDQVVATVTGCTFSANGVLTLPNSVITGNNGASVTLTRCLVVDNLAEGNSGIRVDGNSQLEITNCTVANNIQTLPLTAAGVLIRGGSNGVLNNCIVFDNGPSTCCPQVFVEGTSSAVVTFCDVEGNPVAGTGNIDADPRFVDAANGDYNLLCTSPCIDAGDPNPIFNDPDDSRNDMGPLPAVSVCITISGNVSSDCGGGLVGVTVDLDLPGGDMLTTSTDSTGNYNFSDVPPSPGDGVISIVTPLGYAAVIPTDGQDFILLQANQVFNFTLACLDPTGEARGMGYWKHQANVYLKGKGNAQESQLDMETNFPTAIFNHFFENQLNSIQVAGVTFIVSAGDTTPLDLATISATLTVNKNGTMLDRAKRQYLPALLNVATGKLLTSTVVSVDGATASQALQQVADYIKDGDPSNDETAKDIGDTINNAQLVGAGVIDLDIETIAYSRPFQLSRLATVLHGAAPNPFLSSTTIRFQLKESGEARVMVYDINGRLVRSVFDQWAEGGPHEVTWNGVNSQGTRVASGIYYIRMVAKDYVATKRAVFVR